MLDVSEEFRLKVRGTETGLPPPFFFLEGEIPLSFGKRRFLAGEGERLRARSWELGARREPPEVGLLWPGPFPPGAWLPRKHREEKSVLGPGLSVLPACLKDSRRGRRGQPGRGELRSERRAFQRACLGGSTRKTFNRFFPLHRFWP